MIYVVSFNALAWITSLFNGNECVENYANRSKHGVPLLPVQKSRKKREKKDFELCWEKKKRERAISNSYEMWA